jgi:hypothetical protein
MDKNLSAYLTLDQICQIIGVRMPEEVFSEDYNIGYWEEAHKYAIEREGKTEDEAYEFATKAEAEELSEQWSKYVGAVEQVATDLFAEYHLDLTEQTSKRKGTRYLISPQKSWRDSCKQIVELINGIGYFHFSSSDNAREFLSSGPYTAREGVLEHLHHLRRNHEVYGDYSPEYRVERRMRW